MRRIAEMNTCKKSRDKKLLSHILKKELVLVLDNDNIAKGEIITKTFIRMYLIAYEMLKLKNPKDIELLRIPVKAK